MALVLQGFVALLVLTLTPPTSAVAGDVAAEWRSSTGGAPSPVKRAQLADLDDVRPALNLREDLRAQWHQFEREPAIADSAGVPTASVSGDNAGHFNLTRALLLASLETTVYCEVPAIKAWNCTRCGGAVASFEVEKVVHRHHWDVTALVGYWDVLDAAVVLFRGTNSADLHNWIADLDILTQPYSRLPLPGFEHARVHEGFMHSLVRSGLYEELQIHLRHVLQRRGPKVVYAVGHSLGAAMAAIAAPMLRVKLHLDDVRLWTFGSPRVGNSDFDGVVAHYLSESVRVTHAHDIVPSLPSRHVLGYHHFAREVWQLPAPGGDESGAHMCFRVCDGSGEDPTCHDSACFLGLCHNLKDHIHYLGKHMYHRKSEC